MAYEIDANGNVVWVGPGADPGIQLPRAFGGATPEQQLGYLEGQLGRRQPEPNVPLLPRFAADLPRAQQEEILRRQYEQAGIPYPEFSPLGGEQVGVSPDWRTSRVAPTPPLTLSAEDEESLAEALALALGAGDSTVTGGPTGYTPSFVDLTAAEAMLPLTQTPEEEAALQQMLADLQQRGEEGIAAVRSGWEGVRAINQAAADKAQRMAIEAGPEAARLWIDAANNALTFARQTADAFTNIAGMQRVNISPTGGAQNIAALLAAQAPRARAFAERMGTVSAQDIASQARTAAMMGAAYVGEITRTVLQQAQEARAAHNKRVLDRIASNRQTIAGLRASAATTNAQIANSAAQFAASQVTSPEDSAAERRARIRELDADIRQYGDVEGGATLLSLGWGLPVEVAQQLIDGAKAGILDWSRAQGLVEAEIQTALGG